MSRYLEVCIKGGRELRNFLVIALFCQTNKKHDSLIRIRGGRIVGQESKMRIEDL